MHNYIISSDSTCDLPSHICENHNLPILKINYIFPADEQPIDTISDKSFFENIEKGNFPTTTAPNPEEIKEFFLSIKKNNIIHICFSSGLSSTYNNCLIAAREISEEYPHKKITIIDSLSSSLGEGLLVYKALIYKDQNKSYDEVINYINNIKNKIAHIFTVNDLFYLQKGGRISKATAILGSIIDIKPLLFVNNAGELVVTGKTRGRKKALNYLIESYINNNDKNNNSVIALSHCDCEKDALYVKEKILNQNPSSKIIINNISKTIAIHSGPGTIAIFYENNKNLNGREN